MVFCLFPTKRVQMVEVRSRMNYWSRLFSLHPTKLFLKRKGLTRREFNAIHVRAAKLWNRYLTVFNVSVASDYLTSKFSPLLKRAEGDMA